MDVREYTERGIRSFVDRDGNRFILSVAAFKHIRYDNLVENPPAFIHDVFSNTIAIIYDKTSSTRVLYFREMKKGLYKTVVADLGDGKIKTAFLSREIKGGAPKWVSPRFMS